MKTVSGFNENFIPGPFALAASPARYAVERGDWQGAAALEVRPSPLPQARAITYFAKALGAARSGDLHLAQASITKLAELRDQLREKKDGYWAEQVDIQWQVATAWAMDAAGHASALGHKACRDNRSVLYYRLPRLFDALLLARGDGRYGRLLKTLARVALLILDDWGLAPLTPDQERDLLEVLDDRHGCSSTIVTSQLPVEHWHELIANPTIADAILDRLIHNAHRLILKGDSMRKLAAKQSGLDANQTA